MSGNEPNWNEDEENAGDLYGAPTGTPRPGDESADPVEPLDFVAPLSLDDDADASDASGPDDEATFFDELSPEDSDEPAPSVEPVAREESPDSLRLGEIDEEADADGLEEPAAPAAPAASGGLRLAGDDADEDAGDEAEAEELVGNRPAEGARVVSASEIFSEDFMGAEGASDFLGLDTDFDPTPVSGGSGGSGDAYGDGLDLREPVESAAGAEALDYDESAVATEEGEEGYASPISAPEEDPQYATEYGEDGEPIDGFDGEFDEDGIPNDDELFADDAPAPGGRRGLLVGVALAFGVAAAAAYTFYPQLTGGGDAPVEVASNGGTNPGPIAGGGKTDPVDPSAGGEGPLVEPVDGTGGDPSLVDPLDPVDVNPFDPADPIVDPVVDVDPTDVTPDTDPVAGGTDVEPIDATPVQPDEHALLLAQLLAEAKELERMRGGNASMIDLVWRGETVPMEAIGASTRILTPAVGPVRVHMATLDVFDGHLFAIGENKVWVDLDPGRVGLDGTAVERIERLPREVELNLVSSADLVTGDRVRARVPGGVIYGRVRSKTDSGVTLVTDSGARITLDNPVLESVGKAKSVVLKL